MAAIQSSNSALEDALQVSDCQGKGERAQGDRGVRYGGNTGEGGEGGIGRGGGLLEFISSPSSFLPPRCTQAGAHRGRRGTHFGIGVHAKLKARII